MANLKEIRTRISSVSSTKQITSAMKMVSAAKLRKAQDTVTKFKPYADKLKEVLAEIEKAYLLKALEMAEGKKRKAAQLLGLTLREFRYRLAKHNIGASQD
jgi:F-type H+-transporting ATPase subunit gamma